MDSYIRIRLDQKTKEDFKKAIQAKEPYLVNNRSDGVSAVLLRHIHEYIKDAETQGGEKNK